MIESIIEFGNSVLAAQDKLSALIKDVPSIRNNKQQHVVKFVFDTKANSFMVDVNEEIDAKTANKYMFVGSVDGPASPQWYVTSTNNAYILSELFPNLMNLPLELDDPIRGAAKDILDEFYMKFEVDIVKNKKYAYILDLNKLGISELTTKQLSNMVLAEKKPGKALLEIVQKEFKRWIKEKYNITEKEIGFYTVVVDGNSIASNYSYTQAVLKSKNPQGNTETEKIIGMQCNVCGSSDGVPADLSKMKIKYFTTNQIIFASGLRSYEKNFNLCGSCMEKLQAGENFMQQNLSTRIAGFNVFIVPHLVYGDPLDMETMKSITQNLVDTVNTARSINDIKLFRDRIDALKIYDNIYYLIDFVFYRTSNAATKIMRLIKDIKPSFFERMQQASVHINSSVSKNFSDRYRYMSGLEKVYYLTPIRLKQGNASSFRDLLAMYEAIFLGQKVDNKRIIKNLVSCMGICFYEKEGFNIKSSKENLNWLILDAVYFIIFLKQMGCLKGGSGMETSGLNLPNYIKAYLVEMQYDEQQSAMFLLGYLVGQVGRAQYKPANENAGNGTYKPVLNKLNFNGIDKSKLIRLRSEIFNKLRQEKILVFNEKIFAECSRLMDKNIALWQMNKDENLFYILSGYAYASTVSVAKKEDKINEK